MLEAYNAENPTGNQKEKIEWFRTDETNPRHQTPLNIKVIKVININKQPRGFPEQAKRKKGSLKVPPLIGVVSARHEMQGEVEFIQSKNGSSLAETLDSV